MMVTYTENLREAQASFEGFKYPIKFGTIRRL
jgi:hypothetical protein